MVGEMDTIQGGTRTDNIQGKDRYYACRQIECAHPPVFLSYV